jgi:GT2 family glycosyltransferase
MNLGIQNAKGEFIMISSAHASFAPGYVKTLLNAIQTLPAEGVGGVMKTQPLSNSDKANALAFCLSHKFGVGNAKFRIGSLDVVSVDTVPFGLYRRQTLIEVGLYNTKLTRNQDIELSKRLTSRGGKIFLIPTAECYYHSREKLYQFIQNAFKNGYWNILTVKITGTWESLSIRHFIPLVFLMSLILPSLLAIVYPPLLLISALSLLAYFSLAFYISFSRDTSLYFWRVIGFFSLHLFYGVGSLIGLFTNPKS